MLQKFNGKLVKKEYLASDIVLLFFELDSDFEYEAGQYLMIQVGADDNKKWKPYSIFSPPSQKGLVQLCIKIVEGGFASEIFDCCNEGTSYPMKGPFGRFTFEKNSQNDTHFFIGVGTGLAPLNSMLMENIDSSQNFKLLMGARLKEGLIFHKKFEEMAASKDNFEYKATITREKWDGPQGRVQENLDGNLSNTTFYICGLKEMVFETRDALQERGVDPENIKFERYS